MVSLVCVIHGATLGVRRPGAKQHRTRHRRHRRAQCVQDFMVGIGAFIAAPKRCFIAKRGNDCVTPHGPKTGGMHFDRHAVRKVGPFSSFADDQTLQQWNCMQQTVDVSQYRPGLLSIRSNHHDGRDFAGRQIGYPILETCHPNGDQGQDVGLAAASANNRPHFSAWCCWRRFAVRSGAVDAKVSFGHRQRKDRLQKRAPGIPRRTPKVGFE